MQFPQLRSLISKNKFYRKEIDSKDSITLFIDFGRKMKTKKAISKIANAKT